MTKQEAYDQIKAYFSRPNAVLARVEEIDEEGNLFTGECFYMDDNGNKCAVGCLIPEDLYDMNMENKSVDSLIDEDYGLEEFFGKENLDSSLFRFLSDAQNLHDHKSTKNVSHFLEKLEVLAEDCEILI